VSAQNETRNPFLEVLEDCSDWAEVDSDARSVTYRGGPIGKQYEGLVVCLLSSAVRLLDDADLRCAVECVVEAEVSVGFGWTRLKFPS